MGELTIEKLLRDPGLIHADDMPGPLDLGFHNHCLNAGGLSFLKDFEVSHLVLPVNVGYGPEAAHVECFQLLHGQKLWAKGIHILCNILH